MPNERDDNELEEELRRLVSWLDPVPPELVAAAADAFGWRDIDAELAALVYDSLLDEDEATLVRGPFERRLVSFRAGGVTIDLEVAHTGSGRSVIGQIEPPQRAVVDIRRQQGVVSTEADELGRFHHGTLLAGPMSLRLRTETAAHAPIVTDWVTI